MKTGKERFNASTTAVFRFIFGNFMARMSLEKKKGLSCPERERHKNEMISSGENILH
jgi:hypothetical protein